MTCGNCGAMNHANDQFCSHCGYTLSGPQTQATIQVSPRRSTGTLQAQELISGRYRIVKLVGKGGFGAVYQAKDERFQTRVVALKEMSDVQLSPQKKIQAIAHFKQEANLLVSLQHLNLPSVSDFFEDAGKAYLVMEFVQGQALDDLQSNVNGPLDEPRVMQWALQLCEVLNYLHTQPQPIIFRDLKPGNIMLTKTEQVKLIDFGIARIFKSTSAKDTTSLGSRGYAPLEQYGRGQTDVRSDIYALGATLYDLLTHEVPTDAVTRRLTPMAFVPPRQLNPRISRAAEGIILKAMNEDPNQRFQSAMDIYDEIVQNGLVPQRQTGPVGSVPATNTHVGAPTIHSANTVAARGPVDPPPTQMPSSTVAQQPARPSATVFSRRNVLSAGAAAVEQQAAHGGDFPDAEHDEIGSPYGYRGDRLPDRERSRQRLGRRSRRSGYFGWLSVLVVLLLLAFVLGRFVFHIPLPSAASSMSNGGLMVIQVGEEPTVIFSGYFDGFSLVHIHGGTSSNQVTVQTDEASRSLLSYQETDDKRMVTIFGSDGQSSSTLDVTVPALSNLQMDTNTVPILVENVQGQMVLKTNKGDLTIQKSTLDGPSVVSSSGGTLKMTDVTLNGSTEIDNDLADTTFQGIVKGTGKDTDRFTQLNGTLRVTLLQGTAVHIDATAENGEMTSNIPGANIQKADPLTSELHINVGSSPLTALTLYSDIGSMIVNEQGGV